MSISIMVSPVKTAGDWSAALELRRQVFVEEQKVPEILETDKTDLKSFHVLAVSSGRVVGTGRLFLEQDGELATTEPTAEEIEKGHIPRNDARRYTPRLDRPPASKVRGHIGRLAVTDDCRGMGVGRRLMISLEAEAWRAGVERVVLTSQEQAVKFYEGLGYHPASDVFMEAGIPHRWMEKRRSPPTEPLPSP